MPVVKLNQDTMARINETFKLLLTGDSNTAHALAEQSASWDFKINAIITELRKYWLKETT